jgi:hypothetical protein
MKALLLPRAAGGRMIAAATYETTSPEFSDKMRRGAQPGYPRRCFAACGDVSRKGAHTMGNDWKCPRCGGINSAKRNTCLGCNLLNPDLQEGEKRILKFKEEDGKATVAFPGICARCGNAQADSFWPIISTYDRTFLLFVSTYKKYAFRVPLCRSCRDEIVSAGKKWLWVFLIGIVASGIFFYLSSIVKEYSIVFLILAGIFLVSAMAGLNQRINHISGSLIAAYNGEVYKFSNPEYQKQFDKLNSVPMEGSEKP